MLDLRRGLAVHAVAGQRERYRPASIVAVPELGSGDAVALANAYITIFGLSELYVADLDAILDRNPQSPLVRAIARLDATLWLDTGVRTIDEARAAVADGAHRVVIGLETLPSFDTLQSIVGEIGCERAVFSLDLRNGIPMASMPLLRQQSPEDVVRQATDAGAGSVIVLDLARVGTGAGPDLDLIERIRTATPDVRLIAGGGVRGIEDVIRLEQSGCHGVLVATALLTGKLSLDELQTLRTRT